MSPTSDEPLDLSGVDPDFSPATDSEGVPGEPPVRTRGLLHYVGLALSVVLLGAVLVLGALLIVVPKATGSIPLTVLTQSMKPDFPPGTLMIIAPVTPDEIRIGDVVTYQIRSGDPAVITHRVIGVSTAADGSLRFVLQGDNNAEPDPDPVVEAQIQGRLLYAVPYAGFVNSAVNGTERPWIVGVVAGVFFLYAAWMVFSGVRDSVRTRRARAAAGPDDGGSAPPAA